MSNLQLFGRSEIRFVEHPEGKYGFGIVATDLASALGIINHRDLRADDEYKGVDSIDTLGGTQEVTVIWEPGVYQILSSSRKPKAKPFQRWLFEEVLPAIRKTGRYEITPRPQLPQTYLEALKALVAVEEEKQQLEAEKRLLEQENLILAEAVDELFDYSSIIRIAKFNNVPEKTFSWRTLKAASLKMGKEIKRVPDPRFESKNLYSHDVWRVCYPYFKLPETTTLVISQ